MSRYQELLHECMDLKENKQLHKDMALTLRIMKNNLKILKGGK